MLLKDRTALITGSTSGLGLAIATAFAENGAQIMINDLPENEDTAKLIAEQLAEKYGVTTSFCAANATNAGQSEAMVRKAAEVFGGLDIMVNNVGAQFVCPLEEYPEDKWDMVIQAILYSTFYGTKYAIPHLKKSKYGRIINMSSALGKAAVRNKIAYVTAKHGIVGFTKTTALELAEDKITCNAIGPGFVQTPHVDRQMLEYKDLNPTMSEEEIRNTIMLKGHERKEFVSADQVGQLAVFLASDNADAITGTTHFIDHGWTAR